ncbi:MAG TPA: NAD(+)/NADH kinase, partial [Acidimicrobiales bacterium]|nr:NAD(+)/NADH kinase [Acidimicrobiales bacterium]
MAAVAFVPNSARPRAVELAKSTAAWMEEMGHEALVLAEPRAPGYEPGLLADLDLLVSIGGDGTMLHSVGMVLGTGVPVLGVNFGRFGFLTAIEPSALQQALKRFLAGDYELEYRMTIAGRVLGKGDIGPRLVVNALNDVVLTRPSGTHTINLGASIGGSKFLSYTADSMIVATATGSTGYNLSARGPIVSPSLRCIVLTPVSPHMFFDRSLVLAGSEEVILELGGHVSAELVVDGAPAGRLEGGERLVCVAGTHDAAL